MIEDLEGEVEVMVWPRLYEGTREMWQEGNILRIDGKVKLKEEKLQVTCDSVEIFKLDMAVAAPAPQPIAFGSPQVSSGHNGNGHSNGNGKNGNGKANGSAVTAPLLHKLTFVIHETGEVEEDEARLVKLIELLKEYRGKDEVHLRIINGEATTNLKMLNVYTDFSPDLRKRLLAMMPESDLIVEKLEEKKAAPAA
jgi:DNA polymerase-3 subunit alpha